MTVWVLGLVTLTAALMPRIMFKLHVAYALKTRAHCFAWYLYPVKGANEMRGKLSDINI